VEHMSVGEAARRIGARPSDITNLFYARELRDDLCPVVSGRRTIPESYLDEIRRVLRRRGRVLSPVTPTPAGSADHA
jgi:hypothetical protein